MAGTVKYPCALTWRVADLRTPRACDPGVSGPSRMTGLSDVHGYLTFTLKLSTDVPGFSSMLLPCAVIAKLSAPR